jgi:hypothetical protein
MSHVIEAGAHLPSCSNQLANRKSLVIGALSFMTKSAKAMKPAQTIEVFSLSCLVSQHYCRLHVVSKT